MFIYKFMSGLISDPPQDEESDGYDPHQHRVLEKPTSYADTMIHLLKGSIGAGILAMPDAVSRVGVAVGMAGIVIIGVLATYCIQLLIAAQYELCKRHKRGYMAYPKSMRFALNDGPPCLRWSAGLFYNFVDAVLIVWQLGICVVYVVFVAENMKQVLDFYGMVLPLRVHQCYMLVPLIIVNLVKSLKMLSPMSAISNVVTMFGLILVFFYLIEDDLVVDSGKMRMKSLEGIPIFVGTTLFALEAVGVVLALEYNLENPKDFVGLCGLFNIGMVAIMTLYSLMGLFGYLKYGDAVKASITLSLPQAEKKAQAAKVMFSIAIFLSFPLQNFVAYNIIWRKTKKKLDKFLTTETRMKVLDYALRVVLVLVPWALGVAVPQLGPFISLFGAFCLTLLGVIFPAMMDACLWYPARYGICRYKLVRDVIIMLMGLIALLSGCYTSILEIVSKSD